MILNEIRRVMAAEAAAIIEVAKATDQSAVEAAGALLLARIVYVSGVGKSGDIGQKIARTLTSTGTPAVYLDPLQAMHGELGLVTPDDCVIMISRSGDCDEIVSLARAIRTLHMPQPSITMIGLTTPGSRLARLSDIVINCSVTEEACTIGLAPTSSTAATLAVGDGLALAVSLQRGFTALAFKRTHPGGVLGASS